MLHSERKLEYEHDRLPACAVALTRSADTRFSSAGGAEG
jgi:hypothetical protein